jgi:hypothetical protein
MLPEDERKKQIKALRFHWYPHKNHVLTEFATEVSKIINAAIKEMEANLEGGRGRANTQHSVEFLLVAVSYCLVPRFLMS